MEKRCKTGRPGTETDPNPETKPQITQCAGLIFPYLPPSDLAAVAQTCKPFRLLSGAITSRRISDASRTFENPPIPFLNSIDSEPYAYFLYSPTQTLAKFASQSWGGPNDGPDRARPDPKPDPFLFRVEGASGCECGRSCCGEGEGCECWDSTGFLNRECGPSCRCEPGCGNRVTQTGVCVRLKIVKDRRKGWSLFADEFVPKGKFVCEYAGELITTEEARARQKLYDEASSNGHFSPALLVIKEHLPIENTCMRINIDATKTGNIARFINHSCDGGNLCTVIVRSSGALLPRVCFFASRDIEEDEEVTFSYGEVRLNPKGSECFCGSSSCLGVLPSDHT